MPIIEGNLSIKVCQRGWRAVGEVKSGPRSEQGAREMWRREISPRWPVSGVETLTNVFHKLSSFPTSPFRKKLPYSSKQGWTTPHQIAYETRCSLYLPNNTKKGRFLGCMHTQMLHKTQKERLMKVSRQSAIHPTKPSILNTIR